MKPAPKYPGVTAELSTCDGNALAICARVRRALRDGGIDAKERRAFMEDALSGDYDHVLKTCFKWVNVE